MHPALKFGLALAVVMAGSWLLVDSAIRFLSYNNDSYSNVASALNTIVALHLILGGLMAGQMALERIVASVGVERIEGLGAAIQVAHVGAQAQATAAAARTRPMAISAAPSCVTTTNAQAPQVIWV